MSNFFTKHSKEQKEFLKANRIMRLREKTFSRATQISIPSIPCNIRTVLSISGSSTSGAGELAWAILNDYGLSLQLFKMANSAFYSSGKKQTISMQHLIVMLGLDNVLKVVTSQPLLPSDGPLAERLKKKAFAHLLARSVLAGTIARHLAKEIRLDPQKATVCNTFKSLGHVLLCITSQQSYELAWKMRQEPAKAFSILKNLTGWEPSELGTSVAKRWNLPEIIRLNISPPQYRLRQLKKDTRKLLKMAEQLNSLLYIAGLSKPTRKKQEKIINAIIEEFGLDSKKFSRILRDSLSRFEKENVFLYHVLWDQGLLPHLIIG